MRLDGSLGRRLAWLVLCAMAFGALAPSICRLLAASQGVTWIEICGAQGLKRVAVDPGGKPSPEAPALVDAYCGYCLLQQHSPFVPAASVSWDLAPLALDRQRSGAGATTVFERFVRDRHPTRAPPLFS